MKRTRLALCALIATAASACAPPSQRGMVYVAPGASERFALAMRMGYVGTFDREMVPGQVRRALLEGQLPEGAARTARLGDYVLENGHMIAAITDVDGTARGGRLVDLARKPSRDDALDALELDVLGVRVVYDSLKTGHDETTNTAYVEVSGRIDRTAEDGSFWTVSTRYDAAPGIEGVVVNTHIKLDRGELADAAGHPLLDERLFARGAGGPIVDATQVVGAAFGREGYMLRPLFEGATMTAAASAPRLVVGSENAPVTGDSIVITRIVTPLERPDTGALAVAVAKTEGKGIGDVEVRVFPGFRGVPLPIRGHLGFVSADGVRYDVCDVETKGEDSHFAASLPAGRYTVHFHNDKVTSRGTDVSVQADRVAFLDVTALPREAALAPGASACIKRPAHDPHR